jgi:NAD(P)-dependent dehydrogenase (short-subunit alcohol dehydrogenase family)
VKRAVLITGGNSGIGFECARRLARDGERVVLASRNRDVSREAVRRIRAETGSQEVEETGLDLGSLEDVRRFAREVEERDLPLRALVCNAGVQFTSGRRVSPDGYEQTFAINHLGHFLLVNLLLERLLAHAPARVVVVSSGVHDTERFTGMPKPSIPELESLAANGGPGEFDGRLAYVNSKLCNLWFTYELVRRIDTAGLSTHERPVSVNAYEPGLVPGSGLARDYPAFARAIWHGLMPALAALISPLVAGINTAGRSGSALARVVLDPELERASGRYFPSHTRFREARSSPDSYDEARARELWEESVRLSGLTEAESPLARRPAA